MILLPLRPARAPKRWRVGQWNVPDGTIAAAELSGRIWCGLMEYGDPGGCTIWCGDVSHRFELPPHGARTAYTITPGGDNPRELGTLIGRSWPDWAAFLADARAIVPDIPDITGGGQ